MPSTGTYQIFNMIGLVKISIGCIFGAKDVRFELHLSHQFVVVCAQNQTTAVLG